MAEKTSSNSALFTDPRPERPHHLAGALLALLLLPFATLGSTAQAVEAGSAKANLPTVTVEAAKQHALRVRVDHFVTSVIASPAPSESLMFWNKPVCPLVAGMPRDMGEFMLARISQAARAAGAPLAGGHCQPNLFVIVTAHPDTALAYWLAQDPQINVQHGTAPLKSFINSPQPVRVWYNSEAGCDGSVSHSASAAELNSTIVGQVSARPGLELGTVHCDDRVDTHLTYADLRAISYAIVVVATKKLNHVTIGQLSDYVSLVSLADIRSGADGGGASTILRLFHGPNPPAGMTPWDRALLYSLYHTSQADRQQLTDMEVSMVRRIGP